MCSFVYATLTGRASVELGDAIGRNDVISVSAFKKSKQIVGMIDLPARISTSVKAWNARRAVLEKAVSHRMPTACL
jgi:hypothetical protein